MKNYKECTAEQYEAAMAKRDADLETITNQELYILKTKAEADLRTLSGAQSAYQLHLYYATKERFTKYDNEMRDRMYGKKPDVH